MRFDSPLDDILLGRSHVLVLRALHRLPDGLPASGREVARRAGVTHPTAIKALAVIVNSGLVTVNRSQTGDLYELNRNHLFADQIADLYRTESRIRQKLISFLGDELLPLAGKVQWATLFGSAVWGESTPTSDIDLAICCSRIDFEEVKDTLEDVSDATHRRFGNHISPLINVRKQRPRTGVWKRLEEEGVPLIRSGKRMPM
ncbi:MAG: MarR family transcriptional regulator [Actinomycetota bacterium]